MLTAAQRERCRSLALALDRGDVDTYRRAEDSLTVEERMAMWDLRTDFTALAARGRQILAERNRQRGVAVRPVVVRPKTDPWPDDLDFWADDFEPDDEEEDGDPMPCPACDGTGRDVKGNTCEVCGGSG
jgi:hypothetical protein